MVIKVTYVSCSSGLWWVDKRPLSSKKQPKIGVLTRLRPLLFQAYVIYYLLTNFFIPFIILLFCYSKMCAVLWGNFKQKKEQERAQTSTSIEARGNGKTNKVNINHPFLWEPLIENTLVEKAMVECISLLKAIEKLSSVGFDDHEP